VSFAGTSDIVNVLVESSTPTPDEIYIHEENQVSQETYVESILIVSSSSQSLQFLNMVHQVSFGVSSFSGCLEFSPKFLQISVSPNNVIPLAVFKLCLPNLCLSFPHLWELT